VVLKQGALPPLIFNFSSEYVIRRVQENQKGLKFNRIHQLSAYPDDNIVGENIDTIKKTQEALLDSSKGVGLETNPDKIKYMSMSCYQKAGQRHRITIGNRPDLTHDTKNIGPQKKTTSVPSVFRENTEIWPNSKVQNAMRSYVLIPISGCTSRNCSPKTVRHYAGESCTLNRVL
jgi:hypothetical protein